MSDKGQITIVTHDGSAHMDEVAALAVCTLWLEQKDYSWEIIRSREQDVINAANIVFDVGQEYDPIRKRFDHHQKSFTLTRANGIKYASSGLAWLHFGKELCNNDEEIWNICDALCFQSLDAIDNGINLSSSVHESKVMPFSFSNMLTYLQPTWEEDPDIAHDAVWQVMEHMRILIPRIIIHAQARKRANEEVKKAYELAIDKRLIILDENYPWQEALSHYSEPLVVIYPRDNQTFGVVCVPKEFGSFETKTSLPLSWRGISTEELQTLSGVSDAVFCHASGFKGAAKSLEGALIMALKAIEEYGVHSK